MSRKRITKFLNNIDWMFEINNHEKDVVFEKEDLEPNRYAEIEFEEKYHRMTVYIYPEFFKQDLQNQRKTLLHELCHTLTLPSKLIACELVDGKMHTKDHISHANEVLTSKLEHILDALLQGRLKYAREAYKDYLTLQVK